MTVVAFDLDDTLFEERQFLLSAYRHIAADLCHRGIADREKALRTMTQGGFDALMAEIECEHGWSPSEREERVSVRWCVDSYRSHHPDISLDADADGTLGRLSADKDILLALVTDGRSITQRNKIEALGLTRYFTTENIFISEETGYDKHSPHSFHELMGRYGDSLYVYIGDNPAKDFVWPNRLGWMTIGLLDRGNNIHRQDVVYDSDNQPKVWVKTLADAYDIISNGPAIRL